MPSALTQSEECGQGRTPKQRRRRRLETIADTSQSRKILPTTHHDACERLSLTHIVLMSRPLSLLRSSIHWVPLRCVVAWPACGGVRCMVAMVASKPRTLVFPLLHCRPLLPLCRLRDQQQLLNTQATCNQGILVPHGALLDSDTHYCEVFLAS